MGEFTTDPATITHKDMHTERPGVYIVNASATIRALNRALQWDLPTDGPKTVNGLLVEHLGDDPRARHHAAGRTTTTSRCCRSRDNTIKTVRAANQRAQGASPEIGARGRLRSA